MTQTLKKPIIEHLYESKHWYLKHIKVFADLPEEDKKELREISHMTSYRKHEPICFPGQSADTVYLLKQGRVKIARVNEKGQEATICLLEPGEIFGEVEAIDGTRRETLVQAIEPVLVCEITRENFLRFLDRCPQVGIRLLKTVGGRLRNIESKFGDLVLQLGETMGDRDQDRIRINIRLTHQNLANLIGTSRETVSALLSQFQRQGLLIQDRRQICLLKRDELANIQ
jgi:CRP-like cAMP-binding protein